MTDRHVVLCPHMGLYAVGSRKTTYFLLLLCTAQEEIKVGFAATSGVGLERHTLTAAASKTAADHRPTTSSITLDFLY